MLVESIGQIGPDAQGLEEDPERRVKGRNQQSGRRALAGESPAVRLCGAVLSSSLIESGMTAPSSPERIRYERALRLILEGTAARTGTASAPTKWG